ncbi:hypothetical protein E2562_024022 [Oryza meyeriana var. granulata]|uniref:RBR-type E3 ubiquitin transferase n=1 Tax=Oryza meyeriana var. granulata TaxID=110450 RepID=A0A6G1CSD4_9ORYZ|nr:hypothetical protein E2562_024022 [Oryza meyeriana var. granulata]
MAAASSMDVDDLFLVAVSHGGNPDGAGGVVAMSDEEYAAELQLQEGIMSSAMAAKAAAALSSVTPPPIDNADAPAAHAETSSSALVLPAAECSSSTSRPPAGDAAATTPAPAVVAVGECSCSSSAVPPPSVPATFLFCKICMDDVPLSDTHRGSHGCTHAFCATCLVGHITAKLRTGLTSSTSGVKCPEEGCVAVLDPELSQHILPKDTFERWCAALCWAMVLGASHVYCPFPDCAEIIADERGSGNVPDQSSECPACRRQFCGRCGVAWHSGVSCGEYEELAAGDRGEGDLAVVEMAKGSRWRRCPRCRFYVDRYEGCVHITCRCELEFCYGCGLEWVSADHSSCHAPP